jgi:hypothetical protein
MKKVIVINVCDSPEYFMETILDKKKFANIMEYEGFQKTEKETIFWDEKDSIEYTHKEDISVSIALITKSTANKWLLSVIWDSPIGDKIRYEDDLQSILQEVIKK